jgi:hypothetical protein
MSDRQPEQQDLLSSWEAAIDLWGVRVDLSPPDLRGRQEKKEPGDEPLAYIDLKTRQVVLDFGVLEKIGAAGCLTAVLSHEVGHHVRFPHSLGLMARLQVLEKLLLPMASRSLVNLFFDLQVNEVVGRSYADDLCLVYRGFLARDPEGVTPLFAFYLATYEELWSREPGDLIGADLEQKMGERFPGWCAEARLFAQTFYALPDVYLQFIYFCSRFARFLEETPGGRDDIPLAADLPEPDVDDYAEGISPHPLVERAIREAVERGWVEGGVVREGLDPIDAIDGLCRAGHGRGVANFRQALADHHYRRLVNQYLIEVPPTASDARPDPTLPTTVEPWEPGEDPHWIDWTQSVYRSGSLASIYPWKRELEPDDPIPQEGKFPSLEIYLDTSGSMPNPLSGLNAMTLSAQILSASAIRKGGRVRAVIYSDGTPLVSEWMRDETFARKFLFQFAAGGTFFPFDVLERLCVAEKEVIRVVISDDGFIYDLERKKGPETLMLALTRSIKLVVILLRQGWRNRAKKGTEAIESARSDPAFRLLEVAQTGDLAKAARDLAKALFEERR